MCHEFILQLGPIIIIFRAGQGDFLTVVALMVQCRMVLFPLCIVSFEDIAMG